RRSKRTCSDRRCPPQHDPHHENTRTSCRALPFGDGSPHRLWAVRTATCDTSCPRGIEHFWDQTHRYRENEGDRQCALCLQQEAKPEVVGVESCSQAGRLLPPDIDKGRNQILWIRRSGSGAKQFRASPHALPSPPGSAL